ncbi:MAG: AAA family ATPase [Treponema sp.]|nr:AAA family ATPase [Treponema sp.]
MIEDKSVEELEKELSELPRGYVTTKVINKKTYFYQQWKENGKTKNRCISEGEANELRPLIEKRRTLQKKLNAVKGNPQNTTSEKKEAVEGEPEFKTNAVYGDALMKIALTAEKFDKRDCYSKVHDFLYTPASDKVCLIFGLRRTGKTTILKQLVLGMNETERKKTLYIKVTSENTLDQLNADLKLANKLGYSFIFIDEITLIDRFIDNAALLSDVYAVQGMKIVLSGTDSLGFWFAQNEELYDRALTVHTTYVPFSEHARLLKIKNIDEYIRYGGTLKAGELAFEDDGFMLNRNLSNGRVKGLSEASLDRTYKDATAQDASFRDDESTRRYIDTAIAQNIQHSLKCYDHGNHFRHLIDLYNNKELTNAINRIIEDMNQRFTVDVITKQFKSNDLGSAKDLLLKEKDPEKQTDVLSTIDTTDVVKKVMDILEIRNKENQSVNIEEIHILEIKEYLKALDLIDISNTETIPISNKKEERLIFTQPGMRFCQAQVLVYSLLQDEIFGNLDGELRDIITEKILEDVRGRMLEDIVYLQTRRFYGKTRNVFKLKFASGEFDMVIQNKSKRECEIYEVKHSMEIVDAQYRHIIDPEKIEATEKQFGKVVRQYVLYRGESTTLGNKIEYKNVEEYLTELR